MEVSKAIASEDNRNFYITLRNKENYQDFLLIQVVGEVISWEKKERVLVIKTK